MGRAVVRVESKKRDYGKNQEHKSEGQHLYTRIERVRVMFLNIGAAASPTKYVVKTYGGADVSFL